MEISARYELINIVIHECCYLNYAVVLLLRNTSDAASKLNGHYSGKLSHTQLAKDDTNAISYNISIS